MFERYGPWSSALDDGPSARLGTFWRSRLAMLESARTSRPGLSRRDWLRLGAAGAAACAVPTVRFAPADEPDESRPADGGKIYVQAIFKAGPDVQAADTAIYAIDPATSVLAKLRDFAGRVRISRDGRTLAVSRAGKTGPDGTDIENIGVWTLDAGGKGQMRRVADFGGVTSWSPDGKRLIVVKWLSKPGDKEMRHETWRFDADGSGATKLPIPETDEVDDWSPDGRWLVTVSDRHEPHGSGYQLYRMHPDGSGQRRLTEGRGLNVYPRFSPDGRRIAYLHSERGVSSVWVIEIDGDGRREVIREDGDVFAGQGCWSPDGRSLAWTLMNWQRDEKGQKHLRAGEGNPRIVIVDVEGKTRRTLDLPDARWIGPPDWR